MKPKQASEKGKRKFVGKARLKQDGKSEALTLWV